MKAGKDKVVAVSYELEVEGKTADKAGSDRPLEYIHGTGMLLPLFEAAVEGKEPGETFDFVLSPEDGYGVRQEEYVVDLPKKVFCGDDGVVREDLLVVGNMIPMFDNNGNVMQGTVAAVGAQSVKMDFNHPMAGKTLHFTGKVESVREATQKELKEGLHGEYLPPEECHCGGGCGHGGCCHDGDTEDGGGHGGCCHDGDTEDGGGHGGCCHDGEGRGCHDSGGSGHGGCCGHGHGKCHHHED